MKKYSYSVTDANGKNYIVLGIYFTANTPLEALKKICTNCVKDLTNASYVEAVELSY